MSIQAVAAVLDTDVGEVAAKMLLISIANAHNTATGVCCPSIERLCKETGMVKNTVRKWLYWCEQQGLLRVESRHDQTNGRQLSNAYRLTLGRVQDLVPSQNLGGTQLFAPSGVQTVAPLAEPEEKPSHPLPLSAALDVLTEGGIDAEHAHAVLDDRTAGNCPLNVDEARAIVRYCGDYADVNLAAERLIATRYRGCRGLRRLMQAPAGASSLRTAEKSAATSAMPDGYIAQAAERLAYSNAAHLSGKANVLSFKAWQFLPEVAAEARSLAARGVDLTKQRGAA